MACLGRWGPHFLESGAPRSVFHRGELMLLSTVPKPRVEGLGLRVCVPDARAAAAGRCCLLGEDARGFLKSVLNLKLRNLDKFNINEDKRNSGGWKENPTNTNFGLCSSAATGESCQTVSVLFF